MISIEDPFDQDDFDAYKAMTAKLPSCQVRDRPALLEPEPRIGAPLTPLPR